jgi:predicted lipoprotein with Yx(FWY)xxD motif
MLPGLVRAPLVRAVPPAGPALTASMGMTLYTFDNDSEGKSACTGKCAENYPLLTADPTAPVLTRHSVITHDDGGRQWVYQGKPPHGWVEIASRAIRPMMVSTVHGTSQCLDPNTAPPG